MVTKDRRDRIIAELTAVAADLSGYGADELPSGRTFLALGFDSLFLTQLASAYQKTFKCAVTFRQLIAEQPTIEALADYLLTASTAFDEAPACEVKNGAAKGPAAGGEAGLVEAAAPLTSSASSPAKAGEAARPGSSPAPADGDGLAALFARQLDLMARQLDALKVARAAQPRPAHGNADGAEPVRANPSGVASAALAPAVGAAAREDAGPETSAAQSPEDFGPDTDASAQNDARALSAPARAHLRRLIARYNAKTPGSKAATQRDRAVHADPRTAAGFNPLWKEMVYPIVVRRSQGAHLWDIDGNQYIDLLNGFGPNFFGHRAPFIVEAMRRQLEDGYEIGPQTPLAGEAARLFCELTGMDRVSWVNTGSEAVQAAMRIARTVTGRDKIVVFKGDYHGNFDEVLVRAAGGGRTVPMAPGIPFQSVGNVLVLDYGEPSALEVIKNLGREIAAVLVEPVQSRRPEFQPKEFLHDLRVLTRAEGIVLVFDEVITGFRIAPGGAQQHFGVAADLATYGKIIGGGMPIGVVAGRAEFMDTFDGGAWRYGDDSQPTAGVTFFAGTFVRHPLAMAAAHASLSYLKSAGPQLQASVNARTTRLASALNGLFEERGVAASVAHFSSQMFFRMKDPGPLATLFFFHLRARGVHILEHFPSYLTAAHDDADIDAVVEAARDSVCEMQADGALASPKGLAPGWTRRYPMTDGQRALWFASKADPVASCAYNESDTILITGPLDAAAFRRAAEATFAAHEAFSLRFDENAETQWVDADAAPALEITDLSESPDAEKEAAVERRIRDAATTPFDLQNGPLYRAMLLRLSADEHLFVLYCHHIIFDGYSADLVVAEIAERYAALKEDRPASLAPVRPFSEYAAHRGRWRDDPAVEASLDFWKEAFAGGPPALPELPRRRSKGPEAAFAGDTVFRDLGTDRLARLRSVSREAGVSLNATLFSAFGVLIAKLSGQEAFVIASPAAGQAREGIDTVGYCVNMAPIPVDAGSDKDFSAFAAENQSRILGALENLAVSPGDIANAVGARVENGRFAMLEIIFNYSRFFAGLSMADCRMHARENRRYAVYSDMFFNIVESDSGLAISWDYRTSHYNAKMIERWTDYFVAILDELCKRPEQAIGDFLTAPAFASRAEGGPSGVRLAESLPSAFAAAAAAHARAPAVLGDGAVLTYGELAALVESRAAALSRAGARRGDVVAVRLERSADLIASALAIWRIGAVYLPIDPDNPEARNAYILDDAGAAFLAAPTTDAARGAVKIRALNNNAPDRDRAPRTPRQADCDDRAYILYTSGSTGRPKGVINTHRAVMNFVASMAERPGLAASDRVLALTTPSFDISILEMFAPLCIGASVVVAAPDEAIDGFALCELIEDHGVTVVQGTPASWRLMLDADPEALSGVKALCGGEAMPPGLADALRPRVRELWNMYGPTETTVWSTCGEITADEPVTVGVPVANTSITVVDGGGRPVPVGALGEVWIGGDGVAEGYLNRADETAEKFVADPFTEGSGRVYRTGDWGRMTDEGQLEIVGRRDDQIKLRGRRIEFGEIEAAIEAVPGVDRAFCAVRQDAAGEDVLAAYIIPASDPAPDAGALRRALKATLPHYLVPQHVMTIDAPPLTANNKIDRNALPDPDGASRPHAEIISPRTPEEEGLAAIWRDMLDAPTISVTHNFLELGGQSLKVAQMVARAKRELGFSIPPQSVVFETLEQLAERAGAAERSNREARLQ